MITLIHHASSATGSRSVERAELVAVCDRAAATLYGAEVALHAARQSGVDEWVRAAADRLHHALAEHCAASRALEHRDLAAA